jgi:hypothetical protein
MQRETEAQRRLVSRRQRFDFRPRLPRRPQGARTGRFDLAFVGETKNRQQAVADEFAHFAALGLNGRRQSHADDRPADLHARRIPPARSFRDRPGDPDFDDRLAGEGFAVWSGCGACRMSMINMSIIIYLFANTQLAQLATFA